MVLEFQANITKFLISFSEIERQVYLILSKLPKDNLTKYALKIDAFTARARFTQALLRSSNFDGKEETISSLEEAIELAKFRNQVAHNPVAFDIYEMIDTGAVTPVPRFVIQDGKMDLKITPEKLAEKADEAHDLRPFFPPV